MRRSSPTGDVVVEVDLTGTAEKDVDQLSPARAEPGDRTDPGRGRRRRRRVWFVATAVAAGALVLVSAVTARIDAGRLAALEEIPGVADSLAEPIEEAWRAEGGMAGDLGDRLLVGDPRTGVTRALDVTTGQVVWTREAPDGTAGETCRLERVDVAPTSALCVASVIPDGNTAASGAAVVSRVDVATGRTIVDHDVDRPVLDLGPVEGDVVLVTEEDDGRVGVRRWDPEADEVVWRMVSDVGVAGSTTVTTEWSTRVLSVRAGRMFSVELERGQPLPPQYVNDFRWLDVQRHDLPGGGTVEWPNAAEGDEARVVATVKGADGELLFTVAGRPWFPTLDDGTGSDRLLVHALDGDPTVRAFDRQDGEAMWSQPVTAPARPLFLVGGVLVTSEGSATVGRDVQDGRVRWTEDAVEGFVPVTDGSYVLLEHEADGRRVLAAHRVDDGTRVWTADLPDGAHHAVTVAGGGAVAVGDGWLAGLG